MPCKLRAFCHVSAYPTSQTKRTYQPHHHDGHQRAGNDVGELFAQVFEQGLGERVRAGERLRIMNVLDDDGLTLLITSAKYSHKKRAVSLATGVPDDMAVFVARQGR